ncbi:hypothetical protein [Methylobacterium sp. Leaf117]|uniref:hypothetical protein n=1 Tax=Methylobacterium sp. Leaf117 TaxID=1736260 RepID=UPI0006F20370|nr:hypothetical protein [Methylobacterium sp. Leaf117]KQP80278.1 hypothetical protein ASF57_17985 [Methylobacterium sp. Leaf117]
MTYQARSTCGAAFKTVFASGALLVSLAVPAFAVSVTNHDTKEHTITVDRGAKESAQKVSAGDTLNIDCPERCGFRVVGSGYGRQPGPDGKLIIDKDGTLHFADEATAARTR